MTTSLTSVISLLVHSLFHEAKPSGQAVRLTAVSPAAPPCPHACPPPPSRYFFDADQVRDWLARTPQELQDLRRKKGTRAASQHQEQRTGHRSQGQHLGVRGAPWEQGPELEEGEGKEEAAGAAIPRPPATTGGFRYNS